MIALSYEKATRLLVMMSIYLICTTLVLKGLAHLLEINLLPTFHTLLYGGKFELVIPEINVGTFNIEEIWNDILVKVEEVIQVLIQVLIPTSLGFIDHTFTFMSSFSQNNAIDVGTGKIILKS